MTNTKRDELKTVIGKTVSHNYSITLRARLIKVNKVNCLLEMSAGEYVKDKDHYVGIRYSDSISNVWNAYFA